MRLSHALCLLAALLPCACGGDDDAPIPPASDGTFRLSGALSRTGTRSAGPGIGPLSLPGWGDGTTIDRAVAVSHYRGKSALQDIGLRTAWIEPDGSFALDLPTAADWVVLLEDYDAPPEERVRAYLTLGDLESSLVNIPGSEATGDVDVGQVSGEGDEAQGTTSIDQAAQSFDVDASTLEEMARVDDACRSMVNAYLNWNVEDQIYYEIVPQVIWTDTLRALVDGTSDPSGYTFLGYGLWIVTNDPRIDVEAVCNLERTLRIVPPADLLVGTGETVGPASPIPLAQELPSGDRVCGVGLNGPSGPATMVTPLSFNFWMPAAYFVEPVDGWWHLELDGEVLATFDLNLASPVDAELHPTGAVPAGRATVDGSGKLTGIDVDWLRWDGATSSFEPVATDALEQLFYSTIVTLNGWTGLGGDAKEEITSPSDDPIVTSVSPAEQSWYTGSTTEVPGGAALLHTVTTTWQVGGIQHQVSWYSQPCFDLDGDGQGYCQGDADDELPDVSFCQLTNVTGDPIDDGGTLYQQIASNYYGSFYLSGLCVWAPGTRPFARIEYELATIDGTPLTSFEGEPFLYIEQQELTHAGAGDYVLTANAYDALGGLQDTATTFIRARPFTDFYDEPTLTAELASGGTELLVTFNYIVEPTSVSCLDLLSDANLRLLSADGCDTSLATNSDCGGCDLGCSGNAICNAGGFCYDDGGACLVPMMDCDANAGTGVNGCETDISADELHCGACGRACATGFDCLLGVCRPRCGPATGDCDDNGSCEADLLASAANCGACGHACPGGSSCVDGICWDASNPCPTGMGNCDGNADTGLAGCEADLYGTDAHCGGCDSPCGANERCRGGACHPRCPRLAADCDAPTTGSWLPAACEPGSINTTFFHITWGTGEAPVVVGDRIELRRDYGNWVCQGNLLDHVVDVPGGQAYLPCPGYYPVLTTRVVAQ